MCVLLIYLNFEKVKNMLLMCLSSDIMTNLWLIHIIVLFRHCDESMGDIFKCSMMNLWLTYENPGTLMNLFKR